MKPLGYAAVQQQTVSGRDLERTLLERVTAKMRSSIDDNSDIARLHESLRLNRNIWTTFATDLASPDNMYPDDVKASLISIASYIERNTFAAAKQTSVLKSFVDINTAIIQGLEASRDLETD